MTVSVNYKSEVTTTEDITTNTPAVTAAKDSIIHDAFNTAETIDASSTVPATNAIFIEQALTAGAVTVDLTSLTGVNNLVTDGTGLKVQVFKIKNKAGNASMNFSVGASNGYDLAGAGFDVTLLAGQEFTFFGNDAAPDIATADAEIDVTGTGTEIFELSIVMG